MSPAEHVTQVRLSHQSRLRGVGFSWRALHWVTRQLCADLLGCAEVSGVPGTWPRQMFAGTLIGLSPLRFRN